jgi:acetyltransferase
LVRLGQLAAEHAEIVELDINPLLADSTGVVGVDGRIRVATAALAGGGRLSISPYPKNFVSLATLRDGTCLRIRPVRPEDEPLLIGLTQRMSADDRRLRYFAPMKGISHSFAARLSQIDYDREMALIAEPEDGSAVLGEARYAADADNRRAEFAVAVCSEMKRRGLGQMLMVRLIEVARQRRIAVLVGDVLRGNEAMLGLAHTLGFKTDSHGEDVGSLRIALTLSRP